MGITHIRKEGNDIYIVTLRHSFIKRLFGYKDYIKEYKDAFDYYANGTHAYIDRSGNILYMTSEIVSAINNWRRKW